MSSIAVIGEAVADAIIQPRTGTRNELNLHVLPGGGPVNTAVALSRLGTSTRFLGRLAGGPIGGLLRQHLSDSHVDLSGSVAATQMPTLAIASLGTDRQASYEFYVDGTADWQWTSDELAAWDPREAVLLHAGSLALTQQPGATLIADLLRQARRYATISIDPNVRTSLVPADFYRQALPRWAGLADILRMSQDDLDVLMPGVPLQEACLRLHDAGTPLVVVTRGPDGAHASLRGDPIAVPSQKVAVVDTVGAGDAFTAGLLHRLHVADALGGRLESLSTADLAAAMTFASTIAAIVCQRTGADPPWAHELPRFANTRS